MAALAKVLDGKHYLVPLFNLKLELLKMLPSQRVHQFLLIQNGVSDLRRKRENPLALLE
jgi:hypothetical protein